MMPKAPPAFSSAREDAVTKCAAGKRARQGQVSKHVRDASSRT